jgi:hypothetical protein
MYEWLNVFKIELFYKYIQCLQFELWTWIENGHNLFVKNCHAIWTIASLNWKWSYNLHVKQAKELELYT